MDSVIGTEATMVALLGQLGEGKPIAATSTFLVRVATLWFALLIGTIAILYLTRHKRPLISNIEINSKFNSDI